MNPVRIIIHHTAVWWQWSQLRSVDEYHKSIDFPKSSFNFWVGYTYFIEKDGNLTQTRTDTEMQAHTRGANTDSIGICLAGNFDYEKPSQAQLIALKGLLLRKMTEHAILPQNIFGHRVYASKSCPGFLFKESELKSM